MCEVDVLSRAFPAEVGAASLPRAPHLKPHAARLAAEVRIRGRVRVRVR